MRLKHVKQYGKMTKFYIKPRFISEYTNFRYGRIADDITINSDIKNAMLTNIEKSFSLLKSCLLPVNEYMKIISDIENYTIDRMSENDIINQYTRIFNNSIVNIHELTIHNTECNFEFDTFHGMLTFMKNEINFVNANR